jgi:hypothetical protein
MATLYYFPRLAKAPFKLFLFLFLFLFDLYYSGGVAVWIWLIPYLSGIAAAAIAAAVRLLRTSLFCEELVAVSSYVSPRCTDVCLLDVVDEDDDAVGDSCFLLLLSFLLRDDEATNTSNALLSQLHTYLASHPGGVSSDNVISRFSDRLHSVQDKFVFRNMLRKLAKLTGDKQQGKWVLRAEFR